MCPISPVRALLVLAALALAISPSSGQDTIRPDWRRVGNAAVDYWLAAPATGPVDQVWYSPDGDRIRARTLSGQVFETKDAEAWAAAHGGTDRPLLQPPPRLEGVPPEAGARLAWNPAAPARIYAVASSVYRSDDAGRTWTDVVSYRRQSILGAGFRSLAVSPRDPDDLVVANGFGVWRSLDGGMSWTGLNQGLPNLPVRRIVSLPQAGRGLRVLLDPGGRSPLVEVEWAPGERLAWRPSENLAAANDLLLRRRLADRLGVEITAAAGRDEYFYAGGADGRLWVSRDGGVTWLPPRPPQNAPAEAIAVDAQDPRRALVAFGAAGDAVPAARLLRTINGGLVWDDLSANLPASGVHGVAADRQTGAIYAATDEGVFFSFNSLATAAPPNQWTLVSKDLPASPARDVKLDQEGNQLYVALDGFGVYAAMAPHRLLAPKLVSAADYTSRPAAPGSLLSVLGSEVRRASSGGLTLPVLAAGPQESQIQVPFEVQGSRLDLSLDALSGRHELAIALRTVSPAIFIDRDGTPMVLDADTGVFLDAMNLAQPGARIQLLATGLGGVDPAWPSGLAAPVDSPPRVRAALRAFLDNQPLEVIRATLAPGYVGFYLVELRLPAVVNAGASLLHLEAEGQPSNRVRLYLAPYQAAAR